ncbi:hypothetical protein T12_9450 [Trichinella patagoniensis]|uniref:Uncharacterized protein n=1 Tax=Trichinella patagoniensis TaxID=990121 RepID=A0A0V0ZW03_9BILA|nr:hypothetical protein T12_9450 [Trichinella patagoniensis]
MSNYWAHAWYLFESLEQWFSKCASRYVERFTHRILLGEEHVDVVCTGISTKADEELIDLSEDFSFKVSFDRKTLTQFWLSVTNTYPTRSTTCIKSAVSFYYFLLVRN